MWLFRSLLAVAVLALGPAGCGFTPVYSRAPSAVSSENASELASVRVLGIDDREGQALRQYLIRSLNPRGEPSTPVYYLRVQLNTDLQGQAQSIDGNATIGRMAVTAAYNLIDISTGKVLYNSSTKAYGSFRLSGPRYGSVAAERAAEENGLISVSEDIRASLAAWFANRRANAQ